MSIRLVRGDIARYAADAIVNAANPRLERGGGVCGAIHAQAGAALAEACSMHVVHHGPLTPGEAAVTGPAGLVGVRCVIHTVGPIWTGGDNGEPDVLASAYRSAIRAADELGLRTIAFPSISTGIYRYPVSLAAPVALRAVRDALAAASHVTEAHFVLFDAATYEAYRDALDRLPGDDPTVDAQP